MKRDKDYIKLRESLIPEAEKFANKHCGATCEETDKTVRDAWYAKWSKTFHRRMDHLYALTQQAPACPHCNGTGIMMEVVSEQA